jgi:hypothetical protein
MYPARQFEVLSSFNSGNQLKIIHFREIQPPFPLIYIPQTSSTGSDQIKEIETPLSHIHFSQTSSTETYENRQLQQLIEQCKHRSEVNLRNQDLNDKDMEIVTKEAIINTQCNNLHLVNNKITAVSISIIARALHNNSTLQILYLGGNNLCDAGLLI